MGVSEGWLPLGSIRQSVVSRRVWPDVYAVQGQGVLSGVLKVQAGWTCWTTSLSTIPSVHLLSLEAFSKVLLSR